MLCRKSMSVLQVTVGVRGQRLTRQSASDMHDSPEDLHVAMMPDALQSTPLLQSTPASLGDEKVPPGTPVIEPDVSSTISVLAL
jgi:hypothetical protein